MSVNCGDCGRPVDAEESFADRCDACDAADLGPIDVQFVSWQEQYKERYEGRLKRFRGYPGMVSEWEAENRFKGYTI